MKIEINGKSTEVQAETLSALVSELGLEGARVATALNGQFIPGSQRSSQKLAEGDRIEVLSPMQGG